MRILVTGGTGFVGAHMVPKLVENGHDVFALSRSASSDEKLRVLVQRRSEAISKTPSRFRCPRSTPLCMQPRISASPDRAHPISAPMSSAQLRF